MSLARLTRFMLRVRQQVKRGLQSHADALRPSPMVMPNIIAAAKRDGKFAVAAIMKDEAEYVEEWIEFYLLQGASRIIVYDNGSRDATAEIVRRYGRFADCILVPWRTFTSSAGSWPNVQNLAYAHAIANFGLDMRWMAFVDVDEFLFPVRRGTLCELLAAFDELSSISVPWSNFGPAGHATRPPGLVIENYTEYVPHPLPLEQTSLLRYKTIVDPAKVGRMGTHFFRLSGDGDVFYTERGERCPVYDQRNPALARTEHFQLNHYFTRSLEEMHAREAKGRASRNGAVVESYLNRRLAAYRLRTSRDDKILRFVPALKEQMMSRPWR